MLEVTALLVRWDQRNGIGRSERKAFGVVRFLRKGTMNLRGHCRRSAKALSFLDKMRARLSGGQFRMLNEQLYTCKGKEALELLEKDEGAFQLYHAGYQEQMLQWPKLPVQVVMDWPNARSTDLVVADFGCGDARLSIRCEEQSLLAGPCSL